MNTRTQVLVVTLAVIFLLFILQLVRKQKLDIRYAFLWIVLSASILIMGLFPQLISLVSKVCGVQMPVNMLFFVGFCISLIIIFSLSTALSKYSEKLKRLTQELGLLEEKLRELEHEKVKEDRK